MALEPVIAIITTRLNPTLTDIHDRIDKFDRLKLSGVFRNGQPFRIFRDPLHMHGHRFIDYEVHHYDDRSARERRDIDEMQLIARTRMARER